ncbi:MAG TPA: hypothetical protein DHU55_17140 [Blastocatellia bacterium]|jgi:hypothetical protein|nr:hypothetical protein [Blastocatellia bacterium]HCX31472.1 hypothetical protein [Blastocatellia bacterium]
MNGGRVIEAQYSQDDVAASQFDHPYWNRAQPIEIAHRWSGEEAPASQRAKARIIWSEESLVVRFVGTQTEPLIISSDPQLDKKTIGLWHRDVCEIFLAPDPEQPHCYFEFEAAPTGEWVDLAINLRPSGRETDFEFHSGMTAAAIVGEGRTIIAMRIPWSDRIPKPQHGDKWRGNLFRCVGNGDERYLAWRPTHTPEPNFHVPAAFGWIIFV